MGSKVKVALLILSSVLPLRSNAEEVTFGDRQMQQLLHDRPTMRNILDEHDPAYQWVISQFDAGCYGNRVHWDYTPPVSGMDSEYIVRVSDRFLPPCVRISPSETISGKEKWCLLIYELENLQNTKAVMELMGRASKATLTKEEFVRENMRLEFETIARVRDRMVHWNSFGDPIETERERWIMTSPTDFEQYLVEMGPRLSNEYKASFEQLFDSVTAR